MHGDLQPFRKRVDDAGADAVKAAGYFICAAAELAAGMQHGHDRLHGGDAGLFMDTDRHAASVVTHTDDIIFLDDDIDLIGIAGKRFVDAVVHDFPDEVVKAARAGRSDIHSRAFPHCFQSFQDLNVVRGIGMIHMDVFHLQNLS